MTADDEIAKVLVDGVLQELGTKANNWTLETIIPFNKLDRVLAIKVVNSFRENGLLASISRETGQSLFVTDSSWRCSVVQKDGWQRADFQETSDWGDAVEVAKHGEGVWAVYHSG